MSGQSLQAVDGDALTVETETNDDVVVMFAAEAGIRHIIAAIVFSYSDTPAGGRLTVEDGAANIIVDIDITDKGAFRLPFEPSLRGTINTDLIVTLFDGGAAVVGKLNAPGHYTQG
jgi:hypothetical protein